MGDRPVQPPLSAALGSFPRRPLVAAALALVVRLALLAALATWSIPADNDHFGFGFEMGRIARSLVHGEGYVSPFGTGRPTAWMPPVYPFLLALTFSAFGVYSDLAALVFLLFQSLVGALSVLLLWRLAARTLGPRAAWIPSYAFALYPAAVYLAAGMVWPSTLTVFLVLAVLLASLAARERAGAGVALGGGALSGLLALVDPTAAVVFASLVFGISRSRAPIASRVRGVVLAALGLFVAIVPWLVRNRIAFGEPVFLKSNFGNELWLGNNDFATGHWLDAEGHYMLDHVPPEVLAKLEAMGEPELNRWYVAEARSWMRAHPRRVLELSLRRASWFWWRVDFPTVVERERRLGGSLSLLVLTLCYRVTLVLGLLGLFLALARRRPVEGVALFLLLYPLGYYLTHVSNYRYRYPIEPLLLLAASGLIAPARERVGQ